VRRWQLLLQGQQVRGRTDNRLQHCRAPSAKRLVHAFEVPLRHFLRANANNTVTTTTTTIPTDHVPKKKT
jgi:hypothetical protein